MKPELNLIIKKLDLDDQNFFQLDLYKDELDLLYNFDLKNPNVNFKTLLRVWGELKRIIHYHQNNLKPKIANETSVAELQIDVKSNDKSFKILIYKDASMSIFVDQESINFEDYLPTLIFMRDAFLAIFKDQMQKKGITDLLDSIFIKSLKNF